MGGAAAFIGQTLIGLASLTVLIIMVRFLLWPLFKKQPVVVGASLAIVIIAIAVMLIFNI